MADMRTTLAVFGASIALVLALAAASAGSGADRALGRRTYVANCASCHGGSGRGDGTMGRSLQPPPRDFTQARFRFDTDGDGRTGTDDDLRNVIRNGAGPYGGSPLMDGFDVFGDAELADLIAFLRSLASSNSAKL